MLRVKLDIVNLNEFKTNSDYQFISDVDHLRSSVYPL